MAPIKPLTNKKQAPNEANLGYMVDIEFSEEESSEEESSEEEEQFPVEFLASLPKTRWEELTKPPYVECEEENYMHIACFDHNMMRRDLFDRLEDNICDQPDHSLDWLRGYLYHQYLRRENNKPFSMLGELTVFEDSIVLQVDPEWASGLDEGGEHDTVLYNMYRVYIDFD